MSRGRSLGNGQRTPSDTFGSKKAADIFREAGLPLASVALRSQDDQAALNRVGQGRRYRTIKEESSVLAEGAGMVLGVIRLALAEVNGTNAGLYRSSLR